MKGCVAVWLQSQLYRFWIQFKIILFVVQPRLEVRITRWPVNYFACWLVFFFSRGTNRDDFLARANMDIDR